jgi:hypothetical protein
LVVAVAAGTGTGMTMSHHTNVVRPRAAVAGCVLLVAVGLVTYASAAGESSESRPTGRGVAAPAAEPSRAVDPGAAGRLLALGRKEGIRVVADAMRAVPAPGGERRPWVLAPTREGGLCVDTGRIGFCGADRASVQAGRASATEYPPDEVVGTERRRVDPADGTAVLVRVRPSDGTGVRRGIVPQGATGVVVLDRDGRVVRREAVANGVYEVVVPAQGTGARVAFVDAAGATIAERPAEG